MTRRFGWEPSTFDARDLRIGTVASYEVTTLNTTGWVDISKSRPPIDQGKQVQCCVSAAIVCCMEILADRRGNYTPLSVLFNYYWARVSAGKNTDFMGRLEFRDALSAARNKGVCRDALHPHESVYTISDAQSQPSDTAMLSGKDNMLGRNERTRQNYTYIDAGDRVRTWRSMLDKGFAIAMAFWVTDAYSLLSAQEPQLNSAAIEIGKQGHAVAVVGYNDSLSLFLIKDSLGAGFAAQGYWHLPYALAASPMIAESVVIVDKAPAM